MPWRTNENRTHIQFLADARWPRLIQKACKEVGIPSANRYCQEAIMEKLAKDLDIDMDLLRHQLLPTQADYPTLTERRLAKRNASDKVSNSP